MRACTALPAPHANLLLLLAYLAIGGTMSLAQPRVRAPELHAADAWLNTNRPLLLRDLRGQVILLDFWTYCCINCLQEIPDLKYLKEKYADRPFLVIGIHSGKFDQERNVENVRQALLRHNIDHPVAVDSDFELFEAYTARAWPTFVLIDPEGYVVGQTSGEGRRDMLDQAIAKLLDEHWRKGTLGNPRRFQPERETWQPGTLAFPGKVLADENSQRLFISDTNHHRILVTDFDGTVVTVIGNGEPGLVDGGLRKAQFRHPQGLAFSADRKTLYVADTENHALRAVRLGEQQVETLAGTGEQSIGRRVAGIGPRTALASPWAVAVADDAVYIAMAGHHQIWAYYPRTRRVSPFAGTGAEAGLDRANRSATFAQPSGLATDGQYLYVADAEISSIRRVELRTRGMTTTLAGSRGLFDFGLKDGVGEAARFQHPLGVALWNEYLFVADTFNNTIRRIELARGEVETWQPVLKNEDDEEAEPTPVKLYEPGGLSIAGDTLFIADTNHHRIVAVNIPDRAAKILSVKLPANVEAGTWEQEGGNPTATVRERSRN